MPFSSRSCRLAGSVAVALLAACEGAPGPEPEFSCGATFPSAPDGAGEIVYVAAQCPEAEAAGTKARPFVRIADAIEHAEDGATILVSAGEYKESLALTRPVTIVGSSNPASPDDAALSLGTGEGTPISISGAGVTLIGVRIEGAQGAGVRIDGGEATIAGSVVTGTQPGSDGLPAAGVLVRANGSLTLLATLVADTSGTGVLVAEASAAISGSEVRDSLSFGIDLDRATGEVTVADTTVSGSTGAGIRVVSSSAIIDGSSVTGTVVDESLAGEWDAPAEGIVSLEASTEDGTSLGFADLTVRDSVVSGNGRTGILCGSGTRTVVIQDSTIADNGLPGTDVFEYVAGLWLQSGVAFDPTSEITGNEITGNKLAGIFMFGETNGIPVAENTVSGTLPEVAFGIPMGDGIGLAGGASAHLLGNVVTQSGRCGIMIESAPAEGTEVSGNTIENSAEYGIVIQDPSGTIPVGGNTFSGNMSGDVTEVPAGTYGNPDRPLPL